MPGAHSTISPLGQGIYTPGRPPVSVPSPWEPNLRMPSGSLHRGFEAGQQRFNDFRKLGSHIAHFPDVLRLYK